MAKRPDGAHDGAPVDGLQEQRGCRRQSRCVGRRAGQRASPEFRPTRCVSTLTASASTAQDISLALGSIPTTQLDTMTQTLALRISTQHGDHGQQ